MSDLSLQVATADLLPQSVVQRVKSPYPSTQDAGYLAAAAAELRRIGDDHDQPVARLLDADAVDRLISFNI